MWLTVTLLLGIFLLWGLTTLAVDLFSWAVGVSIPGLIINLLSRIPYLPAGFIRLMALGPNAVLVVLYYSFSLPTVDAIRYASCWEWVRCNWITCTQVIVKRPEQTIYAVFPHGAYGEVVAAWYTTNPTFKGVETLTSSLVFWIPIVREFVHLFGATPATRGNMVELLDAGRSVIIVPDGVRGALYSGLLTVYRGIPGESVPRQGFIQCAQASKRAADISIVPIYHAGARQTYRYLPSWPWLQKRLLRTYGYPWPLLNFGWFGSFLPRPTSIQIHMGVPIAVKDVPQLLIFEEVARQIEAMSAISEG